MFIAPTLISRNWGGIKRAQCRVLCLVTKGSLGEGRTATGFARAVPSPVALSSQAASPTEERTGVPAPTKSFPRLQLISDTSHSTGVCASHTIHGRDEPGL